MKDYLKMAGVFVHDSAEELEQHIYAGYMSKHCSEYAAHAINYHDELVAEVERLTKSAELAIMTLEEVDRVLTERIKNGAYDLDDISGEVTYALDKLSARE